MRRRPPHLLHLSPGAVAYLKTLVEDGRTEQRIARRARVLLAMADPDAVVSELADRLELERTTIWNLCRRYEARGVDVVLDAPRSGRPRELSPLQRVEVEQKGEVVLCVDEKPNIQVLHGDQPVRSMKPALIEHREFEYKRHGTVNLLARLVVHSGRMRSWDLERNNGDCLRAVLPHLLGDHRDARRIHLIWDNGSSPHRQADARLPSHSLPRVRVIFTPAHASWLNQAELLLRAFTEHYLRRGDWASRDELIEHLDASWPEYNRLYAPPSPGPGLAPRCTRGWTGTCPDYVEKLVGHSTSTTVS